MPGWKAVGWPARDRLKSSSGPGAAARQEQERDARWVQQDDAVRMTRIGAAARDAETTPSGATDTAITSFAATSLADSQTALMRPPLAHTASSIASGRSGLLHMDSPSTDASTPLPTPPDQDAFGGGYLQGAKRGETLSDIELSKGNPATAQPPASNGVTGLFTSNKLRLFRPPVRTVSSSLGSRIRKDTLSKSPSDDLTVSSAVPGLVIVGDTDGKQSGTTIDQELGYGDGRGAESVLRRVYDTWSLTSIAFTNIGPLQGAFFGLSTAKEYGGFSMFGIAWPISGLFMCIFSAVLAELSSSYPVAGAMYTWTFRLCRQSPMLRPLSRFLSWICGSFLLCGHILLQLLVEWQFSLTLQGLIIVYAQNYQPTMWRTLGFAWLGMVISGFAATSNLGRSPRAWKAVSVLLALVTLLLIISPFVSTPTRNSFEDIFSDYQNQSGFSSKGYVYLLGWVLTSIATGQDVAAHLAEEARYPSMTVPRAIFWSTALSYICGWGVMLSYMAVTQDVPVTKHNVTKDYGAPAQILTSVLPRPLAFICLFFLLLLMMCQDVAQLLASSRFVWALARDSAIPFSGYFRHLSKTHRIPVRASWMICTLSGLSMLLVAASKRIVTSLVLQGAGAVTVLAYATPVIVLVTCGTGVMTTDGRNEWTLRAFSRPAAWIALLYVGLIIVMMACPNGAPVNATTFSYAIVIIVAVILLSMLTWILYGNAHYAGPIKSVTVYTIGREVELPKSGNGTSTYGKTPGSAKAAATPEARGVTTTDMEVGKTANLFSESIPTREWSRSIQGTRTSQLETGYTEGVDTYMTGDSWTGSEGSDGCETDESDSEGTSRRPAPASTRDHPMPRPASASVPVARQ